MKKFLPMIMYALLLMAVVLLGLLLLPGCSKKQLDGIQTQLHDINVQIETTRTEKGVYNNLKKDCEVEEVTFGKDSTAFYTRCPNSAKPIRKLIIQKSYPLTNDN